MEIDLDSKLCAHFRKELDITTLSYIPKGWSEDKKYCATKTGGEKCLLRISPFSRYADRKAIFSITKQLEKLDIPMCLPLSFGVYENFVYSLQSWIDGKDLNEKLPLLPETVQYALGVQAGAVLRKIHSLPAPSTQEAWAVRFNRKANFKIEKYRACGLRFDGDDFVIGYIENNRHLLANRPQSFQHGDYHVGNMMLADGFTNPVDALRIIDFDRYDYGDPWEEFNRIVWSATASPYFATGQLHGYFQSVPPLAFFRLLAFYIASNTLSSIYWAVPFGQSEINTMMQQAKDVLHWYNNMKNPIPKWYLKDLYSKGDVS